MWEKLKEINKKWYYLIAVLIILAVGGAIAGEIISDRYENKVGRAYPELTQVMYSDLLRLQSVAQLGLSQAQAKEILPLVEKLNSSTATSQLNIIQQIYALLTPEQYLALSNQKDMDGMQGRGDYRKFPGKIGKDRRGDFEPRGEKGFRWDKERGSNPKAAALVDVVIKMLKDIAAGNSADGQPSKQNNTVGDSVYSQQ